MRLRTGVLLSILARGNCRVVAPPVTVSKSQPFWNNISRLPQQVSQGFQDRLNQANGLELFAVKDANLKALDKAQRDGSRPSYKLTFYGCMVAGALSRSVAQVALHPFNVLKTLLQTKGSFAAIMPLAPQDLMRGAGAQFALSLPNGAFHFAVLEWTKHAMADLFPYATVGATALFDFTSCSLATAFCSIMSTPQMVLTNRIMAGMYPNLMAGVRAVAQEQGLKGFYVGWLPGLVQKIPSYGLTWVFFQQAKDLHFHLTKRGPKDGENFWLGCAAAAASVTLMIPMDTVKTRLVTQGVKSSIQYSGILDCFTKVLQTEGIGAFYNSLAPRLMSVAPMIGIQYGVLSFLTKVLAEGSINEGTRRDAAKLSLRQEQLLDEAVVSPR